MNKSLHDTHFHLDLFNNEMINLAKDIEKNKIYTIAVTNLPPLYIELNKKLNFRYIRPALGFHPELINEYKKFIPIMWKILPEAKYIGEVGLDFQTNTKGKKDQIFFFETLIEKCDQLGGKIITIHSRKSSEEVISIIGENFNGKYILHWFSGNMKSLEKAINNGAYFSINYSMIKSAQGRKIISRVPENKILIETDGPFIKYGKKPFTPLNTGLISKGLSKILNKDENNINNLLFNNFKELISI